MPQRGRATAAVAEAGGGVPQVEAAGQELAGGVVPQALDGELDTRRGRQMTLPMAEFLRRGVLLVGERAEFAGRSRTNC